MHLTKSQVRTDPSWCCGMVSASRSNPGPDLTEGHAAPGLWLCQPARDKCILSLGREGGLLSGKPSPICFQSHPRKALALEPCKYFYQQDSVLTTGGHMCLAKLVGLCNPALVCFRAPHMGKDAALLAILHLQQTSCRFLYYMTQREEKQCQVKWNY